MVVFELFHRFTASQTCINTNTGTNRFIGSDGGTWQKGRNGYYNDSRRILAFSVAQSSSDSNSNTRSLCADRRGFLDHLRPKIFFKNVR